MSDNFCECFFLDSVIEGSEELGYFCMTCGKECAPFEKEEDESMYFHQEA